MVAALACATPVFSADYEGPAPLPYSPPAVWFPPAVPVVGEAIMDTAAPTRRNYRLKPPSSLADFVNEIFYPPLSTRLYARSLRGPLSARLDDYRMRRGTLLNELANQIVALHGVDDPTRLTELQAFAAQQTPRIRALEWEAEELRQDLIDGGVLQQNVDWNRRRKWKIGATRFNGEHAEKEAHFQVVRAAAYYQDELTPEQRGLLLESASELQARARAASPVPSRRKSDPAAMFFSPALARMRMPRNASPELVARIGRLNREKTALKQELLDTVLANDDRPADERTAVFSKLADSQWPRLIELEKLAEEIRVSLAETPAVTLAAPPHIPPGLMARIKEYNRDRGKFIQEFEQTMRTASSMVPTPRIDHKMPEDARVQLARKLAEDRAALRGRVAERFQEDTRERFEAMRLRFEAIQADLALVAAGQFDPETGRPLTPETLLRNYSSAMERFDTFGREEVIYRGYRTAMLLPGLSPEQRRLLFGAALVGLAQPLPYGEYLPSAAQPVPQSCRVRLGIVRNSCVVAL
jgi:hypothetical protein